MSAIFEAMPEKVVNLYTAILTTVSTLLLAAVTAMGGIIFHDIRTDIEENRTDIRAVSSRVTDVQFSLGQTNVTVDEHGKKIEGLYDMFGTQPTFRRER